LRMECGPPGALIFPPRRAADRGSDPLIFQQRKLLRPWWLF
jgi:hypothetical protein